MSIQGHANLNVLKEKCWECIRLDAQTAKSCAQDKQTRLKESEYRLGVDTEMADKGKIIALCVFILLLIAIYADQNRQDNSTTNTPTNPEKKNRPPGGSDSPIIVPPYVNIGVYEEENCSTVKSSIDWGTMYPGQNKNSTVYMKNEGTTTATPLLSTSNWVFKDENDTVLSQDNVQYFNLTWSYDNTPIEPTQVVQTTLYLYVSFFIANVTSFAFNIIIGW